MNLLCIFQPWQRLQMCSPLKICFSRTNHCHSVEQLWSLSYRVSSVLWDVMVVKKSTRSSFETTWGRERQWPQQAWVRAGGRILTEEKGVWDQEVMLCKTQWGSKVVGGWVCTGVCQRESLVGIKAPSLTHASTSPVWVFFWVVRVCVVCLLSPCSTEDW